MEQCSLCEIEGAFLQSHWLHQSSHRFGKAHGYPRGFLELKILAVQPINDERGFRLRDEPRG